MLMIVYCFYEIYGLGLFFIFLVGYLVLDFFDEMDFGWI